MKKQMLLYLFALLGIVCGCSEKNAQSCYEEAHSYYVEGNLTQAVPLYFQCISYCRRDYSHVAAQAYKDIADICYRGGYYKMAYEINEKSVKYFELAHIHKDYNLAKCRSAVYKALLGEKEEALAQLHLIHQLSSDSIIKNTTQTYSLLLQSGQKPNLNESSETTNPFELYNAVLMIRHEFYKKPQVIKFTYSSLLFIIVGLCIYITHSGLLQYIQKIRKEKNENAQLYLDISKNHAEYLNQYATNIVSYCEYLRTHPEVIKSELHWSDYDKMCSVVNVHMGNIVEKIRKVALLNESEMRLCILVLINLTGAACADILPYAANSVGKLKNTVSKKVGTDGRNLHNFLKKMALDAT